MMTGRFNGSATTPIAVRAAMLTEHVEQKIGRGIEDRGGLRITGVGVHESAQADPVPYPIKRPESTAKRAEHGQHRGAGRLLSRFERDLARYASERAGRRTVGGPKGAVTTEHAPVPDHAHPVEGNANTLGQ
jgi:hypothetical protein